MSDGDWGQVVVSGSSRRRCAILAGVSAPARILPERYDPAPVESNGSGPGTDPRLPLRAPLARRRAAALPARPKAYVLEMLPYPSGEIHIGHVKNYTMGDVVAAFRRRNGAAVFHRWATTRSGCRPRTPPSDGRTAAEVIAGNIARICEAMQLAWASSASTGDGARHQRPSTTAGRNGSSCPRPGLAERREAAVNWCQSTRPCSPTSRSSTAAASAAARELEAAVTSGSSGSPSTPAPARRHGRADRLAPGVAGGATGSAARGAPVVFRTGDGAEEIPVFPTRPDTLFGATFFVLAPEHPAVGRLVEGSPRRRPCAVAGRRGARDRRRARRRRRTRPRRASSRAPRRESGQRRGPAVAVADPS